MDPTKLLNTYPASIPAFPTECAQLLLSFPEGPDPGTEAQMHELAQSPQPL